MTTRVDTDPPRMRARLRDWLHPVATYRPLHVGLVVLLCLLAALSFLGIGRNSAPLRGSDTSAYLSMGHYFLQGEGFRSFYSGWDTPVMDVPPHWTHYPPGFPLLLAGLEALGFDPRLSALMAANALLLFGTLLMTALYVLRRTGSAVWAALTVPLILYGDFVFRYHLWALSEPLFTFLTVGATFSLIGHYRQGRYWLLPLAGLLYGFSLVTRYAGIPIVGIMTVIVLLAGHKSVTVRLRDTALFGVLAGAPLLAWLWRNSRLADSALGNHTLTWEPLLDNLGLILNALLAGFHNWLALLGLTLVLAPAVVFGVATVRRAARRQMRAQGWQPTLHDMLTRSHIILSLLLLGYFMFVLVGGTIANFDVDHRKLTPLMPLFIALSLVAVHRFVEADLPARQRQLGTGLVVVGLVLLALSPRFPGVPRLTVTAGLLLAGGVVWYGLAPEGRQPGVVHLVMALCLTLFLSGHLVEQYYDAERELNRQYRRFDNELVDWLEANAAGTVIYSNVIDQIHYYLDDVETIEAMRLKFPPASDEPDAAQRLAAAAAETGGIVVVGHEARNRVTAEQLVEEGGFVLLREFPEGRVYVLDPAEWQGASE